MTSAWGGSAGGLREATPRAVLPAVEPTGVARALGEPTPVLRVERFPTPGPRSTRVQLPVALARATRTRATRNATTTTVSEPTRRFTSIAGRQLTWPPRIT
ncbi:hypothetical protein SUDANB95_03473 [Actinosynnema sp. ALI-1.44]